MEDIRFRITTPETRPQVQAFMDAHAKRWYGCAPPPADGVVIAAWKGDEVVGTGAFDFPDEHGRFPFEHYADLTRLEATVAFPRNRIVQAGRWFATEKGISLKLGYAVAEYCVPRGITHMACEVKDVALDIMKRVGMQHSWVFAPDIDVEKIPPAGRAYYEEESPVKIGLVDLIHLKSCGLGRVLEP